MLLPTPGQEFTDNYEIVQHKNSFYQQALTPTLALWEQANTDTLYECGSAQLWSGVYGNLPAYARKNFNFNFIRPSINMIVGRQMQNRKSSVWTPRENASQMTADQMTKIFNWNATEDQTYEKITQGFRGSCITGINLVQIYKDIRSDAVSGQIKTRVKPFNTFIMDPYWTDLGLSDCQGIIVRDFLTKKDLIAMYPEQADLIMNLPVNGYGNARDSKFQYTPESYNYGLINLMTYDQFYYRDYRQQKVLYDVNTGEGTEWRGTDNEHLKFILQQAPELTVIDQQIPTVRMALFIQDKCLYDGPNGLMDDYPLVPFIAYYHPEIPYYEWRIQSVVRSMRDTQFLYNRFIVNMADVVESQVNSGWKYKENALVDPNDVFLSGQGKGLALKKDAQMTDVEKIVPTEASQTAFKLADTFLSLKNVVSGVSEELLGAASDDVAGVLAQLRQGAGLVTLQPLFDQLDQSQKILSQRIMDAIRVSYVPAKLQKIIGKEEQLSPFFYNQEFGKYECVVEEGYNTATQKQMQYAQLLQARELLGDEIPTKTIIEAMTIQNKDRLMKDIEERQQQKMQMEQKQAEAQMQLQQQQAELAKARAVSETGLGLERLSRVDENHALAEEREAQAERDHEEAIYTKVKVWKELESLDHTQLKELIMIHKMLHSDVHENKKNPQPAQGVPETENRGL